MIITVTLNPALDKTAEVEALRRGELNRLKNTVTDAGGKGINVSKMISALGGESIATGFLGGVSGSELETKLNGYNISADFVRISGSTRTNLKVLDGELTELNEPGPVVSKAETEELVQRLLKYSGKNTIFVLSGSLPGGIDCDFYGHLIEILHEKGSTVFLDADGDAFKAAISKKPDFIKPNRFELMEYYAKKDSHCDTDSLKRLCVEIMKEGAGAVALSMGSDGALFLKDGLCYHSPGIKVLAHSTVGAGDSMVGATAYGWENNMNWRDIAALAIAASAGAVTTTGTKPPSKELVDALLEKSKLVLTDLVIN